MLRLLLFLAIVIWPVLVSGQQVAPPVGTFSTDTVKIGLPVTYTLVHKHSARQEIILPGTNYNFTPFELVRKDFYPTRTIDGLSTDSAVYTLRTFDTKAVQALSLPVFILQGKDTIRVNGDSSRVVLHQLVDKVREPLTFKNQTTLMPVAERFNWPVLLLWITFVTLVSTLIWLIFGQTIKTKYKLYRLRKDHLYFTSRYNSHIDRFVKTGVSQSMEKAVSLWKNYLTKLERSAINSFTTKEIVEYYDNNEEVNDALRLCDKAIYGNVQHEADTETKDALLLLRRFAKSRYKARREITKNAKNNRRHAGLAEPGMVQP
ncbi:hypothetical protein H7F15_03180 [Pontibacter sp. Tf4]|uniref:hypothetical protein n=1 Tax=Pontibacter sp. Tf4 TaxID=2761620 RepID=UPI0016251097|nr:hypothetical protein [Pontibacter sp. Tf4]MBB6610029.1 hypothetical protein [Pontibacter sp. Tf4]